MGRRARAGHRRVRPRLRHEALGEIARSAGEKRLGHGRGNSLSLEDVAEGRKAVTDLMPRPGPCPAASMAGHLSVAVNQRHLAKLEIAVGAAQQLEHLRGRVTEPQETQSQRLQRRVDERLRRNGTDAGV